MSTLHSLHMFQYMHPRWVELAEKKHIINLGNLLSNIFVIYKMYNCKCKKSKILVALLVIIANFSLQCNGKQCNCGTPTTPPNSRIWNGANVSNNLKYPWFCLYSRIYRWSGKECTSIWWNFDLKKTCIDLCTHSTEKEQTLAPLD